MPSPPITVGELNDVPSPESPINAQFHQEVAHRIVHRFANVGAMNAWAAANGSLAYVAPTHYARVAGLWVALTYQANLDALANRPVTSAMIQDSTIMPVDLNPVVLSEGWQTIGDTGSNWSGESGYFKRLGNMVMFHFQGSCAANGFSTIYNALPVGYRPGGTLYFDTPGSIGWQIAPTGIVSMLANVSGQIGVVFAFDATYPAA